MTGLFDTFGRHFAVLTKFLEKGLESHPIGQGGHSKGPGQGGDQGSPTGPAGWSRSRPRPTVTPELQDHPLRAPAGPYGARSAVLDLSPSSWVVPGSTPSLYPPGIPTLYTHPGYTPVPHPSMSLPAVTGDHWDMYI